MTKLTRHKSSIILVAASVLCLLIALDGSRNAQVRPSTGSPSSAACTPILPPPCKDAASPGVIQLIPDVNNPNNKLKLARKRFYLSSCPLNLAKNVDLRTAPSLRSYYGTAGASPQFIAWLEQNNCETIYCRELTADEVKCDGADPVKCVPEFTNAYKNALSQLNGDQSLALKLITNYPPLSSSNLRTGFYHAKTNWLKTAVGQIESELGSDHRIKSTITDKDGIAFFYDLCPGSYYISSVAPIDVDGIEIFWETLNPIKVEGPPDVNRATVVTLGFPPNKDKKNYFVGKPVAEVVNQKTPQ